MKQLIRQDAVDKCWIIRGLVRDTSKCCNWPDSYTIEVYTMAENYSSEQLKQAI